MMISMMSPKPDNMIIVFIGPKVDTAVLDNLKVDLTGVFGEELSHIECEPTLEDESLSITGYDIQLIFHQNHPAIDQIENAIRDRVIPYRGSIQSLNIS